MFTDVTQLAQTSDPPCSDEPKALYLERIGGSLKYAYRMDVIRRSLMQFTAKQFSPFKNRLLQMRKVIVNFMGCSERVLLACSSFVIRC
jgi:hypothetical protein